MLAAAVLTIGSVPQLQIYAAPSPTQKDVYTDLEKAAVKYIDPSRVQAVDIQGKGLSLTVTPVKDEDQLMDDTKAKNIILDSIGKGNIAANGDKVSAEVMGIVDVASKDSLTSPAIVTIPVARIKAGDNVVVLQYMNGGWVQAKNVVVGDDYVKAEVSRFTPMAVVRYDATAADDEIYDKEDADDEVTSGGNGKKKTAGANPGDGSHPIQAVKVVAPKTADSWIVLIACGMAAVSLAGIGMVIARLKTMGKRKE